MNHKIPEQFERTGQPARVPLHVQLGCKPFRQQFKVCAWILVIAGLLLLAYQVALERKGAQFREMLQNAPKWELPAAPTPHNGLSPGPALFPSRASFPHG